MKPSTPKWQKAQPCRYFPRRCGRFYPVFYIREVPKAHPCRRTLPGIFLESPPNHRGRLLPIVGINKLIFAENSRLKIPRIFRFRFRRRQRLRRIPAATEQHEAPCRELFTVPSAVALARPRGEHQISSIPMLTVRFVRSSASLKPFRSMNLFHNSDLRDGLL